MSINININGENKKVKDSFISINSKKKKIASIWVNDGNNEIKKVYSSIPPNIGVFVATGTNGLCYYSNDGINWNKGSGIDETDSIYSLIYANKIFLAGCSKNYIYYSNDGITWNKRNFVSDSKILAGEIFYMKEKNYFICKAGSSIYYSNDGISWNKSNFSSSISFSPFFSNGNNFYTTNGLTTRTIYRSSTGSSWSTEYYKANCEKGTPEFIYVPSKDKFYGTSANVSLISTNTKGTLQWKNFNGNISAWSILVSLIYEEETDSFICIDKYQQRHLCRGIVGTNDNSFKFTQILVFNDPNRLNSAVFNKIIKIDNKFIVVGYQKTFNSSYDVIKEEATIYYTDTGINNLSKIQVLDEGKQFYHIVYGDMN